MKFNNYWAIILIFLMALPKMGLAEDISTNNQIYGTITVKIVEIEGQNFYEIVVFDKNKSVVDEHIVAQENYDRFAENMGSGFSVSKFLIVGGAAIGTAGIAVLVSFFADGGKGMDKFVNGSYAGEIAAFLISSVDDDISIYKPQHFEDVRLAIIESISESESYNYTKQPDFSGGLNPSNQQY